MEYSVLHKKLLLSQNELENAAVYLKYAMKQARGIAGVSLGKRNQSGPLEAIDHLERSILEAGRSIGLNFGSDWGADIDLTENK